MTKIVKITDKTVLITLCFVSLEGLAYVVIYIMQSFCTSFHAKPQFLDCATFDISLRGRFSAITSKAENISDKAIKSSGYSSGRFSRYSLYSSATGSLSRFMSSSIEMSTESRILLGTFLKQGS